MALDFAAGCMGGCAGVMVGYPLDTVKVHIQTQDSRNPKYTGTWHCFRTILARESVAGLYRGMSSPMAGVAVVNAIVFGIYGTAQRQLSEPESLFSHFIAGASAGLVQSPICSPMELAKTRLQLQSPGQTAFSGPLQCLSYIYRNEGFRGVFKGLSMTFVREAPAYGIYFLTYEMLTRTSSPAPISTFHMLMAGGLAGSASWVVTYPVDVIKSRLQAEVSQRYSGAVDCLRQSIRDEGYSCLFRGLNSTIIRAFPTNAATFAVVTWVFRLFSGDPVNVAPPMESKPIIVVQPSNDLAIDGNGFLAKWNAFVTSIWTSGYSKSYSNLSATGLDRVEMHSPAFAVIQKSVDNELKGAENKKVMTDEEIREIDDKVDEMKEAVLAVDNDGDLEELLEDPLISY